MKVIDIAKDFSRYPAGRVISDGPYSGEKFRTDYLVSAVNSGDRFKIILDGTRGYGSSFLEEAFGGLVRVCGFNYADILNQIDFVSSRPVYVEEIKEYIKNAGTIK